MNTQWLVGGVAGDYGCDVMEFVWGDGTVLKEVELVKFNVCYFFGECKIGFGPMTGSVVGVVVFEGGCGRYLRDRSSCENWCETTSHVKMERWSGWSMRVTGGPHVVRRATELWESSVKPDVSTSQGVRSAFCCCVMVACYSGSVCRVRARSLSFWRPRCNRGGVVKTVDGTVQFACVCGCVFSGSVCGVRARSSSSWRPRCNRGGVVRTVDGTVQFAAVLRLRVLGLCMWGLSSVVKLLGGRGAIVVVSSSRLMTLCILLLFVVACNSGSVCGFELGRQAAWRPRGNHGGVVKTLVTLCSLLVFVIACYLGSLCGVQARPSS